MTDDPELAYLREKAKKGAASLVESVLSNPDVQALIRRNVTRETFKGGFAFAILFTGLLMIYQSTKAALGYDWRVDLALGTLLFLGGLRYIYRRMK
jgi:hypothetical protein